MIGEATLVPPIIAQPFSPSGVTVESYTATPLYGSASAAMSATARFPGQPTEDHPGTPSAQFVAAKRALHPPPPAPEPSSVTPLEPPSFQTVSPSHPPVSAFSARRVPPTPITCGELAGYWAASASSPVSQSR